MRRNEIKQITKVHVWINNDPLKNHLAIQTDNTYVSFYIDTAIYDDLIGLGKANCCIKKISDFETDIQRLQNAPTKTITLSTIDTQKIEKLSSVFPIEFRSYEVMNEVLLILGQNNIILSNDERELLALSSRTRADLDKLNINLLVNAIILFFLAYGGISKPLQLNQLADAISENLTDPFKTSSSFTDNNLCLFGCLWVNKQTMRAFTISFFILEIIFLINYFVKVENLNEYMLIGLIPFSCFLCCCCQIRNFSKLRKDQFKEKPEKQFDKMVTLIERAYLAETTSTLEQENATDTIQLASYEVLIRIWYGNPGHISLQTSKIYASFWPESIEKTEINHTKGKLYTLNEDLIAEQKPPDKVILLNDLNVDRINEAYFRFQQNDNDWSLLGSSLYQRKDTQNCCGLVVGLLRVGGLSETTSKKSWFIDCGAFSLVILMGVVLAAFIYFPFWKVFSNNDSSNSSYLGVSLDILSLFSLFCLCCCCFGFIKPSVQGRLVAYTPKGIERLVENYLSRKDRNLVENSLYQKESNELHNVVVDKHNSYSEHDPLLQSMMTN